MRDPMRDGYRDLNAAFWVCVAAAIGGVAVLAWLL